MRGTSNTQRTLAYLKDKGFTTQIVERWVTIPSHPGGGRRIDLFGIIDIIALDTVRIIGVQSCGQAFAEHDRKILGSDYTSKWLQAGGQLWLIGWRKLLKKRGGKQKVWMPRVKRYTKADLGVPQTKPEL